MGDNTKPLKLSPFEIKMTEKKTKTKKPHEIILNLHKTIYFNITDFNA